jgi:phosphate acetyltransferase
MVQRPHVQKLVERARRSDPLRAAHVFPCDRDSVQLALSGAFAGYLHPTLVGPEARIRDVANHAGLDISRLTLVDTPDEPRAAAARAVALAREGAVGALIKGSLRNEDLLAPVAAADSGLRTDTRLSHACVLDLPGLARPLVLADAQLNVNPNLAAKRDILLNTLQLAAALGIATPRVALLAAMDGPSQAFPSTTDAVALKSMAAQGHFGTAIVEGPLTPDQALTRADDRSEVAGHADVLIAPSMESAIILQSTLTSLTQGLAAGVVLGARVPVVLVGRSDTLEARMASCVVALLMHASSLARPADSPPAPPGQGRGEGGDDAGRAIAA